MSKCGVFSGPFFPVFGLNTEQKKIRIWTLFTLYIYIHIYHPKFVNILTVIYINLFAYSFHLTYYSIGKIFHWEKSFCDESLLLIYPEKPLSRSNSSPMLYLLKLSFV